jgi:iron(III) transport system ATP-binding protein
MNLNGPELMGVFHANSASAVLRLQGVSKRFGDARVLNNVHLDLQEGELCCLLGPSGCGKSTLLRIICGLERADQGRVLFQGLDITRWAPGRRRFGVVFQSYALFPNLTVMSNVQYGLMGLDEEKSRAIAAEMLDLVGLRSHALKLPSQLSGGEQQRAALARALAPRPSLLLLDEPLSALDAQVRQRLRHDIRALTQRLNVTTLLVTHDQDEALEMADQVVLMRDGSIEQQSTPTMLYAQPRTSFAASFIGRINLWRGARVTPSLVRVGSFLVEHLGHDDQVAGADVMLGVRPEAIALRPYGLRDRDATPATGINTVAARIAAMTFHGAYTAVLCDVTSVHEEQGVPWVQVDLPSARMVDARWRVGDAVQLRWPPWAVMVLDRARVTMPPLPQAAEGLVS